MEYYRAIKRNKLLIRATIWVGFKGIRLRYKGNPKRPHAVLFYL